jgi:hypothetical protein
MTELKLRNDNNKLACDAFLVIQFAPIGPVKDSDLYSTHLVKTKDGDIYCQLVDFLRLPFSKISSLITLPAAGVESREWCKKWKEKYPSTTDDTEMGVYYYKRVNLKQ